MPHILSDASGPLLSLLARFAELSFAGYPLLAFVSLTVTGFLVLRHHRRKCGKTLSIRLFVRAFFAKRMIFAPSGRVDIALFVLNATLFPVLFGWMMLSGDLFADPAAKVFAAIFGHHAPLETGAVPQSILATVVLFLAYEFGYWLDHYLSHRIPFLWHFHKVHHTATALSIATVHRVHPMDTVVFGGILALTGGVSAGFLTWVFGRPPDALAIGGQNLFLFTAMLIYVPLQHSGVWLAFTGAWGHVFLSPAHHQLHHADDPALYGSNLGSCLSIFDWMFGTLKVPDAQPPKLSFGVAEADHPPEGIVAHVVQPFLDAGRMIVPIPAEPLAKM